MARSPSGTVAQTPDNSEQKTMEDKEDGYEQKNTCRKVNLFEKIVEKCENLILFSLLHLQRSPLETLIGPGSSTSFGYILVHACYFVIVSFIPIAYVIANLPGIRSYIGRDVNICVFVENPGSCGEIVSNIFANRFGFAVASLFVFMALITMKCFARNEQVLPALNNGFWILKLSLIFLVSLIAFSIPPGIFDAIWHYLCTAASFLQTICLTFLLIDWTRDVFINTQNSSKKQTTTREIALKYLLTVILTLLSVTALIYTSYRSLKENGLTLNTVVLLMLPVKFAICNCFLSEKDKGSIAQSAVILSYLVLRLGLLLEYEADKGLSLLGIYLFIDTIVKLITLVYALSREMLPTHYRFGGAQMHGRIPRTFSNASIAEKENGMKNTCDVYRDEKVEQIDACEDKLQGIACNEKRADQSESNHLETKDWTEKPSPEREKNLAVHNPSATTPAYSITLLHCFLLTTSLDLNSNLTSFHVLAQNASYFETGRSLFATVILNISTVLIMIIFLWTRMVRRIYKDADEFSSFTIFATLSKTVAQLIYKGMVEPPRFAATANSIKYLYTGIFGSSLIVSFVVLSPAVKKLLEKSAFFCSHKAMQRFCLSADPSSVALYRISISTSTLFLSMSVVLLGVTTLANPRNKLHLGFWPTKLLLLALTFLAVFLVPSEVDNVWKHFALAASLLVTLIQVVVVLDCTSQLIAHFHTHEESSSKKENRIFFSCSSIAVLLYTIALTAFFCFYVYFAQFTGCKSNRIFICINLGLCIMASIISLHPSVKDGGLVQSAVVTSFCMYCTWTALYNNPRDECNPMAHVIFETALKPTKTLLFIIDFVALMATLAYVTVYTSRIQEFFQRFAAVCFRFNCFKSTLDNQHLQGAIDFQRVGFRQVLLGYQYQQAAISLYPEISMYPDKRENSDPEADSKHSDPVPYSYSLFHMMYALMSMHAFILLITWVEERPGSRIKISFHWTVMCIKIVSSSTSVLLYTWSLVVHLFLKNINRR